MEEAAEHMILQSSKRHPSATGHEKWDSVHHVQSATFCCGGVRREEGYMCVCALEPSLDAE
eukprot:5609851-Ditylum_brightwellii.AAC.1